MSDMQRVLRGVVRDHRLPCDYKYSFAQPYGTRAFLKNFKRFLVVRQITKQNITIPLYMLFGFMPVYVTGHILYNYISTGSWPQFLQG